MPRFNLRAWSEHENRRNAWMATKPEPRPVQRIPAYVPTDADIQRESRQIYYGQLIHQGHDEQAAHEMTIAHFAIADHVLVGTLRDEE